MAIEKFTTRALILEQYANGENDVMIKAFTEEFGVINVLAKSLKKREGKLKAHVRKYHYANITLVKGREIWRLSGASEIIVRNKVIPEISKFITRLYRGEVKSDILFKKIFNFININSNNDTSKISSVDSLKSSDSNSKLDIDIAINTSVYKLAIYSMILIELGYMDALHLGVKNMGEYKAMAIEDLILYVSIHKDFINNQIRLAIRESML